MNHDGVIPLEGDACSVLSVYVWETGELVVPSTATGLTKDRKRRVDAPSVVGFETSREVMDDLKRLEVLTPCIEVLDEGVVVVCQVILSKVLGQRLSKGTD